MFIEVTLHTGDKKKSINTRYIISFAPSINAMNTKGTLILIDQLGSLEVKESYQQVKDKL